MRKLHRLKLRYTIKLRILKLDRICIFAENEAHVIKSDLFTILQDRFIFPVQIV